MGNTTHEVNTSTSRSFNYKLADVNPDPRGGLGTASRPKANKPSPNSPHVPSAALSELSLLDRIDSRNIKVGKFTFIPISAALNLEMISAPLPCVAPRLLVRAVAASLSTAAAAFTSATTSSFTATSSTRAFSSRRT